MSDPIASLTAEVERLAGLLRDANAEIARLRGDAPTEPDRSGWPVLVADCGGRYRWPDGNPAVMPSGEREGTFRAVVDGSCGDVFYATAQAAADAIEARLPEEGVPTIAAEPAGRPLHPATSALLATLADLDESDVLVDLYGIKRGREAYLDLAVYAWRDAGCPDAGNDVVFNDTPTAVAPMPESARPIVREAAEAFKARAEVLVEEWAQAFVAVTPPKVGDRRGDLTLEQMATLPAGSEFGPVGDPEYSAFGNTIRAVEWDKNGNRWATVVSSGDTSLPHDNDATIYRDRRLTRIGPAPEPPPTTDPPKLLIGMVVEWAEDGKPRAYLLTHDVDGPDRSATAIYDTIADYRAGRALWRR